MRTDLSGRVSVLPGAGDGADSWQIARCSREVAERAAAVLGGAASPAGGWRAVITGPALPVIVRRTGAGVRLEIDGMPGHSFALDLAPFALWQIASVRVLVALAADDEDHGVACALSADPLMFKTRGGRFVRYVVPRLAASDVNGLFRAGR
ncbi:hypothetical protein [Streptacidiphilus sp. MAP12-20]|uniref:hypothetical protein n=1 Tax=Streptacidiphilus sp. MAP12-20 TaxID=3156299 RepID=UPI003517E7F4